MHKPHLERAPTKTNAPSAELESARLMQRALIDERLAEQQIDQTRRTQGFAALRKPKMLAVSIRMITRFPYPRMLGVRY